MFLLLHIDAGVLTDSNIYAARDAWFLNQASAQATYGHISDWDVRRVTSFAYLFCGWSGHGSCNTAASSFDEDISRWNVSSVTSLHCKKLPCNALLSS